MLRGRYRVIVQTTYRGEPARALIALHARRSAASVSAFREAHPDLGIAVVLTGTDLYRDLPASAEAKRSLAIADRIVTLQDDAPRMLPASLRRKCEVIFQSARPLRKAAKPRGRLDCVVVGHLREEKDPETLFRALSEIPAQLPLRVRHIGAALDERLARGARRLAQSDPRYRWIGPLPHGLARQALRRAHVLVHPSRMEGGANVIVEAVASGTPVIASRMSGNVGMLGRNYSGYFPVGDASALAAALVEACEDPGYLAALRAQCDRRKALFVPAGEAAAIRRLVAGLLRKARG